METYRFLSTDLAVVLMCFGLFTPLLLWLAWRAWRTWRKDQQEREAQSAHLPAPTVPLYAREELGREANGRWNRQRLRRYGIHRHRAHHRA